MNWGIFLKIHNSANVTTPTGPWKAAERTRKFKWTPGWVLEIFFKTLTLFSVYRYVYFGLCLNYVPGVYNYIWYNLRPSPVFSSQGTHRFLAVPCRQEARWINKTENTAFSFFSLTRDEKKNIKITQCSIMLEHKSAFSRIKCSFKGLQTCSMCLCGGDHQDQQAAVTGQGQSSSPTLQIWIEEETDADFVLHRKGNRSRLLQNLKGKARKEV